MKTMHLSTDELQMQLAFKRDLVWWGSLCALSGGWWALLSAAAEEKAIIVGVSTPISTLRQTKPKGSFSILWPHPSPSASIEYRPLEKSTTTLTAHPALAPRPKLAKNQVNSIFEENWNINVCLSYLIANHMIYKPAKTSVYRLQ